MLRFAGLLTGLALLLLLLLLLEFLAALLEALVQFNGDLGDALGVACLLRRLQCPAQFSRIR